MLTDAQCKNAVCPQNKLRARLADAGGLYLEVSPSGSKRWFWKYRKDGKEGRLALGGYPEVGLTAARRARDAARLQKAAGMDPVQARKVEKLKAVNPDGDSFKVVALEWYEKQEPQWSEAHASRSKRQLERDLFPWIGSRRIAEIEPVELLGALRKTEQRGAIETADRGLIQPGKVQSYVRAAVAGGAGDDGLLQRFGLAVWPDVSREFVYVDRWPDTPARQTAWAVFERLNELAPAPDADPLEWRFSADAQRLFEEWLGPFETEIRGDELHPALVSHLAKYRKLIPALALLFALVDTPSSGNRIEERELLRALAWADYLRTHAERLYAAAVMPETAGAQTLLSKLRAGRLSDGTGRRLESFAPRLVPACWAAAGSVDTHLSF